MHSIISVFLIKASSRNAIRKTMWKVSGAAVATSCLKIILFVLPYSPNHRHAGIPMINILSTLRISYVYKNVSPVVLFCSSGNSYTSLRSQVCVYVHICFTICRWWLVKRNFKKMGQRWMPYVRGVVVLLKSVQTGSGAHTASCSAGTGGKAARAWSWHSTSGHCPGQNSQFYRYFLFCARLLFASEVSKGKVHPRTGHEGPKGE
jgi:hypothetical protein